MKANLLAILFCATGLESCIVVQKVQPSSQKKNASTYEQVDFQDLMKRYMQKQDKNSIEGVYMVSGTVVKKGKPLLGREVREKTTDRKENYARVAILKDGENGRDYIELSLDKEGLSSYSVIGEFNQTKSGSILVYKHYQAKGKFSTFTFSQDQNSDLLEGVRVDNEGSNQVTYKLSYVKLSQQK